MKESLYFVYNGISSEDMGLMNVNVKNGLFEESFIAGRSINEVKVRGRDKPYFVGIEREPLEFELEVAFVDGYNKTMIANVIRWLSQEGYREFYMSDNPDRRFLCTMVNESTLIHNGLNQGYITLTMRCDSPYSYSAQYNEQFVINGEGLIELDYYGTVNCKPDIYIEMIDDGDVLLKNSSFSGETLEFKSLKKDELIYLEGSSEYIESSIGVYRYDNFNGNILELTYGNNYIQARGNFIVRFAFRNVMAEGY